MNLNDYLLIEAAATAGWESFSRSTGNEESGRAGQS